MTVQPAIRTALASRRTRTAPSAAVVGLAALLLAACSTAAPTTFDLTAPSDVKPARGARGTLIVAVPSAVQVIDSDRILVRGKDEQVSYLPNVQWAAQLPGLVQARLLQTFENAKRGGSVARPDDNVVADARLVTEIRRFEIETVGGTTAVVEISAKIVDGTTGRISAAHIFSSRVATGPVTGVAASTALDEALQSVLREIVAWVSPRA